jgi:signal transduction histidine kinase
MQGIYISRARAWAVYVALGALAIAAYFSLETLPGDPSWLPRFVLYNGIHLSVVVALVVGIRRHRPARSLGWWLLVANQVVYCAADIVFYALRDIWHVETFPNVADALYVAAGALLAAALLAFIHGRGGSDRAAAIDALTVGVGVALLSWVILMAPYTDGSLPLPVRVTSLTYPVLDLVFVTLAARLIMGGGRRAPSFYFLTGGLLLLVANDSLYGWMQIQGLYQTGAIVDGGWLIFYLCVGAAALHPSMRRLSEPTEQASSSPRWSRSRLALLAAAALIAPVLLAVETTLGRRVDHLPIAVASMVLFLLVIARLSGLMRDREDALRRNERQRAALRITLDVLEQAQAERAQLLGAVVEAAERERTRLAAELHDGPIQHLSSMAYAIDRADRRFTTGESEKGIEILRQVRDHLGGEIADLRRMMAYLRPPVLDEGGLESALRDYTQDFGHRQELACRFEATLDGGQIVPDVETIIYRVSQEALTNVARHANARHVQVRLLDGGDTVELQVHDDGRGFDLAEQRAFARRGHFGLLGMRERVEGVGGTWTLRSTPGGGTTVCATLPRQLTALSPAQLAPMAVAS